MVQNLGANSILHVVAIKWIMCVQDKLPSMPQRLRLNSSIIVREFSLATTIVL